MTGPMQPTRVRLDVIRLTSPGDGPAHLEMAELTADDPTLDRFLERLKPVGTAHVYSRVDTVLNLASASNITHGCRIPVVTSRPKPSDSQSAPKITRESVGIITDIEGRWREDDPSRADIKYQITARGVCRQIVKGIPDHALPIYRKVTTEQSLVVTEDKPTWWAAGFSPVPFEAGKNVTHTIIVRLIASRCPGFAEASKPPESPDQAANIRIDAFELICDAGQVSRLDADLLTAGQPSAEEMLKRLGKIGVSRILCRPDFTVTLNSAFTISSGTRVPFVTDVVAHRSKSGADPQLTPTISYEEVGIAEKGVGHWREDQPRWANLFCVSRVSALTDAGGEILPGTGIPLSRPAELSLEREIAIADGASLWTVGSMPVNEDAGDNHQVILVRHSLKRVDQRKP